MTAQVPDLLLINGEYFGLAAYPEIPKKGWSIIALGNHQLSDEDRPLVSRTSCWRGYVATWEFQQGVLRLVGVKGRYRLRGDKPIKATWFTGTLRVPFGKMLKYVHAGHASVFEHDLLLDVRRGRLRECRVHDYKGASCDPRDIPWCLELVEQMVPIGSGRVVGSWAIKLRNLLSGWIG